LTAAQVGAPILVAKDVSQEVQAIQEGRANGTESADWPEPHTFESWVRFLSESYLRDELIEPKVTGECKGCEFRVKKEDYPGLKSGFEECWSKALGIAPKALAARPTILDIWKLGAPKFLEDGVYFLDQLSEQDFIPKTKPKKDAPSGLTTAQRKTIQWKAEKDGKGEVYFDREGFQAEVADYQWPLHFIDFETTMVAIPFNKGRRPYEQIAFQFSHHTLDAKGKIEHAGQWINTKQGEFPNFAFVRALKKELEGDNGVIFRYSHHENTVLCQIREQLKAATDEEAPDREELIAWIQTIANPSDSSSDDWEATRPMVDLCELVVRFFWHPRMGGSNSIKVVLPAILETSRFLQEKYAKPLYGAKGGIRSLNYEDQAWVQKEGGKVRDPYKLLPKVFDGWDRETLDRLFSDDELADGGAAMMAYARMQFSEMKDAEREELRRALLRYCELDTFAMVLLWEAWTNPF
jgi:hypothetical protein